MNLDKAVYAWHRGRSTPEIVAFVLDNGYAIPHGESKLLPTEEFRVALEHERRVTAAEEFLVYLHCWENAPSVWGGACLADWEQDRCGPVPRWDEASLDDWDYV